MVDVQAHENKNILIILDKKYGIHIIDISDAKNPVYSFFIEISNGYSLELKGNVILLIV